MENEKLTKLEQKQAELQRKQDELKAKIRAIKSKENAEKRKRQTHLKFLLGAYALADYAKNGINENDFRSFIKDDKKADEILEMIKNEKSKK